MAGWFRSSDFKANTYFHRFREELEEAKKRGHAAFVNEVRKCNNCKNARKPQADASIKGMLSAAWPSFKEKHAKRLSRPGPARSVERFIGCRDFSNGCLFTNARNAAISA